MKSFIAKLLIMTMTVVLSCLCSCIGIYTKMSHITAEEKVWINAYEEGDTVYLKSNFCAEDTLIVTWGEIDERLNPIYIHFIDNDRGPYYSAQASYEFVIKSRGYEFDGSFGIVKDAESAQVKIYSNLYGRFSKLDLIPLRKNNHFAQNKIHPDVSEFIMDSVIYKECIVFNNSNSKFSKHWNPKKDTIKRFVINKDFGLIYYEKYDGEVFKRDWVKSPAKRHL